MPWRYPPAAAPCSRGILSGRLRRIEDGEIESSRLASVDVGELAAINDLPLSLQRSERNNRSVVYGESFILKIFRRIEEGINPDLEIGRYLTEKVNYQGTAPVVGSIEYRRPDSQPATLAVLHRYVVNQGTAWQYTIDQLSRFFEQVAALALEQPAPQPRPASLLEPAAGQAEFNKLYELIDGYLDVARMLGQRTAELHLALAENRTDPALAPEPFGKLYQRSLYQSSAQSHRAALRPTHAQSGRLLRSGSHAGRPGCRPARSDSGAVSEPSSILGSTASASAATAISISVNSFTPARIS